MRRHSMLSRVPRWAWVGLGIVGLAAVIGGVAALSAPRERPAAQAPVTVLGASDLVAQAREAMEAGDTTAAAQLAGRALVLDPDNAEARRIRDELDGTPGEPVEPVPPTPVPAGADVWLAAHEPRSLMPTDVAGYVFGTVVADATDAEVSGEPLAGSAGVGRVSRVQMAVHDRGSAQAASAFVTGVSKRVYARDATSAQVNGATAYVATDGTRLAAVSFVRGRYAFEVIVTAEGPPAGVRDLAVALAMTFPSSP